MSLLLLGWYDNQLGWWRSIFIRNVLLFASHTWPYECWRNSWWTSQTVNLDPENRFIIGIWFEKMADVKPQLGNAKPNDKPPKLVAFRYKWGMVYSWACHIKVPSNWSTQRQLWTVTECTRVFDWNITTIYPNSQIYSPIYSPHIPMPPAFDTSFSFCHTVSNVVMPIGTACPKFHALFSFPPLQCLLSWTTCWLGCALTCYYVYLQNTFVEAIPNWSHGY